MESLKLEWTHTWPGEKKADFTAKTDDGRKVGRVYHSPATAAQARGEWYWTCNGRHKGRSGIDQGHAATKNEAARCVERVWFDMVERIDRSEDTAR